MISTLFSAFPPVHFVSLHPFRPHVRLIWHILFLSAREVLKFLCLPRLVCNARASTASRRTTHAKTAAFGHWIPCGRPIYFYIPTRRTKNDTRPKLGAFQSESADLAGTISAAPGWGGAGRGGRRRRCLNGTCRQAAQVKQCCCARASRVC